MPSSAADSIRTRPAAEGPGSEQLDALMRELSEQLPGPRQSALRDHVIRQLLPMAHRVARRFRHHGEEFEDLVQVASLGLVKAVDGYDPSLGHAFLSYALPKVTGELRRHLRDGTACVRLPRPLQEASGHIFRAVEELEQQLHGCSPDAEQIAERTGLQPNRVLSTLRAVQECRPRSLDESAGRDQEAPLSCLVGSDDPALGRVVDNVALASLVKRLPERDRRVIYLRFYREHTQQQIADGIGVSQMQVSRILRRCCDQLREALRTCEPFADDDGNEEQEPVTGPPTRPTRHSRGRSGTAEPLRPAEYARPAAFGPAPVKPVPAAPDNERRPVPARGGRHVIRQRSVRVLRLIRPGTVGRPPRVRSAAAPLRPSSCAGHPRRTARSPPAAARASGLRSSTLISRYAG